MKIAIDARSYFLRSGSGRYTRGVVNALLSYYPEDQFAIFLSNHKTVADFPLPLPHADILVSQAELNDEAAEETVLRAELLSVKADVAFFPFFILPPDFQIPAVTAILDLTAVHQADRHLEKNVNYIRRYLDQSIAHADRIIAISEYVRKDIIDYARAKAIAIDPGRVNFIYPGIDEMFFGEKGDEDESILRRYDLAPGAYLLYVGSIEARKNVDGLLRAYDRVAAEVDIPLIIAGLERWGTESFRRELAGMSNGAMVRCAGYVPDEDLPALYRGARALAYPSLSEGFGFPVAEAYAAGTPVVTSNTTSLREIGEAAYRIDPLDTGEFAQALKTVTLDEAVRADLIRRGKIMARRFTWRRCAGEIHAVFHSVSVGSHNRGAES